MIWTKYTIQTTTKDADMVSAILMDYGINDVQIENNVQLTDEELNQMYADFVKELPPDDGSCSLSFYVEFEDGEDRTETDKMLGELVKGLDEAVELYGIEPTELICEDLNSADWENNWKEFFKPFTVDDILIVPTWEEIPEDVGAGQNGELSEGSDAGQSGELAEGSDVGQNAKLIIRIDPGMAFGTGTHETTRLCLRALQKYLKEGDKVLDLGCGSGILGIAAMKLGAERVVSVDIDEQAVKVAVENFEINEVAADQIRFFVGNVVEDTELQQKLISAGGTAGKTEQECLAADPAKTEREGIGADPAKTEQEGMGVDTAKYDIVTVNILADVINVMMPTLDQYLKEGGILITSGILNEKEQLIRDAIGANPKLTIEDVQHDGDWVSIVAKCV